MGALSGLMMGGNGCGQGYSITIRRAKGFGMKTRYFDVNRNLQAEQEVGAEFADFDRVLSESDFLTIHTNLTPETHHLIGAKEFEKMKRNCILVNTSRGPIVDNIALYEALRDGKIAYAALDVTDPEPIPKDHPLLTLQNVIIVPHIASASVATRTKMGLMAADNLIAGLKGEMPPNAVNPEALKMPH